MDYDEYPIDGERFRPHLGSAFNGADDSAEPEDNDQEPIEEEHETGNPVG